jgi:hypothetical protein
LQESFVKKRTLGLASWTVLALVTGCASEGPYKGPTTTQTVTVEYSVDGIQKHTAYPNDSVWFMLSRPGADKHFYSFKLTVDNPTGKVVLDAGQTYTARLVSYEGHFGGYTNCTAEIDLSPGKGEGYAIAYSTQKTSCNVTTKVRRAGSQRYDFVATHVGSVGGQQFSVR